MRTHTPLHTGWHLTPAPAATVPPAVAAAAPVPAAVPGCVHTDLLTAGLIPDPYRDAEENGLGWIGRTDWTYTTVFDWTDTGAEHADLAFDGLDTVATITLNGTAIAHTANMHRSHRFPVRHLLRDGANRLDVHFGSPYAYAEELRDRLGDRPNAYPEPFPFIRKNACNFGWDWGPTLVTSGIWRPAGLDEWSTARLASVRPQITADHGHGRVELHVDLAGTPAEALTLTASCAGATAAARVEPGHRTALVVLDVPRVRTWWPRGYGEQPLYDLRLDLTDTGGRPLDTWHRRTGFRSARLDTGTDEHGRDYAVTVNDRRILVRGANWIPDDVFPARVDRDRYARRLRQAADAGVNLLRVWGGGLYEDTDFYELADELGLLVTQDFPFACAAYPEEEPIGAEVDAEARDNIVRLAHHPSLVLWTGNNETIWGREDWDWKPALGDRSWGGGFYFDLLPSITAALDPARPYWPGSPYSGDDEHHPNDPAYGNTHIWDVWNTHDYTHYRTYTPRFVAEFGYQAPPAYATLRAALADDPLRPDSPGMAHHQKAEDGDAKLARGLIAHFGTVPADFDDWHWLAQLNQARALSLGISHFRSLRERCSGTVMWQLNDCWPVTSWSAVDGDGRRKPLWHALRDVHADRLLTVQERDGRPVLFALNETGEPWTVPLSATRRTFAGEVKAVHETVVEVAPYGSTALPVPEAVAEPGDGDRELLLAEGDGIRAWWYFGRDKDLAYPRAEYEAAAVPVPGGYEVTVTAGTLMRDVMLFPDRVDPDAEVDRGLVTLLPGETAVFTVSAPAGLDPEAFGRRPVLRCVNDGGMGWGHKP